MANYTNGGGIPTPAARNVDIRQGKPFRPSPTGSRLERRAWAKTHGGRRAPKPYVKAAHVWHDETGICVIHNMKCARPES